LSALSTIQTEELPVAVFCGWYFIVFIKKFSWETNVNHLLLIIKKQHVK